MGSNTQQAYIDADWPKPSNVAAIITTRCHPEGLSVAPFEKFNLGTHVGDNVKAVRANRACLEKELAAKPGWLRQVHSCRIVGLGDLQTDGYDGDYDREYDGSYTQSEGIACTVMTADCLPVFLCDTRGEQVMCLHAGWRGLAKGILSKGVQLFPAKAELLAYLGPAISAEYFEVGEDVKAAFKLAEQQRKYSQPTANAFRPSQTKGKYFADLYQLARCELQGAGVSAVYGGEFCTFSQPELFYSYRRDGETGRFASLIWRRRDA